MLIDVTEGSGSSLPLRKNTALCAGHHDKNLINELGLTEITDKGYVCHMVIKKRRSRLGRGLQEELTKCFCAGVTARTAAEVLEPYRVLGVEIISA